MCKLGIVLVGLHVSHDGSSGHFVAWVILYIIRSTLLGWCFGLDVVRFSSPWTHASVLLVLVVHLKHEVICLLFFPRRVPAPNTKQVGLWSARNMSSEKTQP